MTNATINKTTLPPPSSLVLVFKDSHKAVKKKETEHSMAFKQMLPHFKRVCLPKL